MNNHHFSFQVCFAGKYTLTLHYKTSCKTAVWCFLSSVNWIKQPWWCHSDIITYLSFGLWYKLQGKVWKTVLKREPPGTSKGISKKECVIFNILLFIIINFWFNFSTTHCLILYCCVLFSVILVSKWCAFVAKSICSVFVLSVAL